jgi:flagellar hook-length control protein FliK
MNVLSSNPAVGSKGDVTASPRSANANGGPDKADGGGFEAMLQGKSAQAKPKPSPSTTGSREPASTDAPGREDTSASASNDADVDTENVAAAGPTDKAKPESSESVDEAPWPPPGLSALLPPPAETPPAPAPASNVSTSSGTAATPAATLAATTSGVAGLAQAAAAGEAAEEVLPPTASIATDKVTSAQLDSDVPAPTSFNAVLHSQSAQDLRGPAPTASADAPTPTPDLNSGDFDEAIGTRVSWLAEQKIGHAHIRITPHDLGQVEVKLQLDGERVHASFTSAHADVRQALENSLPRLREMLGEQGLQLAHADVGQQQSPQQQGEDRPTGAGHVTGSSDDGAERAATTHQTLRMRGLLDAYA